MPPKEDRQSQALALMRSTTSRARGHNAIWEMTARLMARGTNPDHVSHEPMAAELRNHLVDGIVLTPGIVTTIPELQQAGFHYAA